MKIQFAADQVIITANEGAYLGSVELGPEQSFKQLGTIKKMTLEIENEEKFKLPDGILEYKLD